MLTWQVLVSISALTYSLSSLLQRVLMRDDQSDPYLYSIVFQLTVGGLIFVYTLFVGFNLPNLTAFLPNLVALTVLYALGGIALFYTFKSVDAASAGILTSTRSLTTSLTSTKLGRVMLLGLFYGIAAVTVFLSYQQGGDVSQVGPISQTQAVLTVFLGALILKEKKQLVYKFLGAIATVGGVALLT